jgi:hypothetical protein
MDTMTSRKITRLQFKDEGENADGRVIGMLTDQNAEPVFADGRWVTKQDAQRIARDLAVELLEC